MRKTMHDQPVLPLFDTPAQELVGRIATTDRPGLGSFRREIAGLAADGTITTTEVEAAFEALRARRHSLVAPLTEPLSDVPEFITATMPHPDISLIAPSPVSDDREPDWFERQLPARDRE